MRFSINTGAVNLAEILASFPLPVLLPPLHQTSIIDISILINKYCE
jgi:hypothetical protein